MHCTEPSNRTNAIVHYTTCVVAIVFAVGLLDARPVAANDQQSDTPAQPDTQPHTQPHIMESLSGVTAQARWESVRQNLFGDKAIVEDDSVVLLNLAERAVDAAMVPVAIDALVPQNADRYIDKLHLVVDKNPVPLAGVFEFGAEGNEWASIETRIRVNEYTHVRAIAEMNDGSLHMDSSFIKAAGGCSVPGAGDQAAALARAGKMKLALRRTDRAGLANSAEAMVKISHPNNSGMQFDQVKKEFVPAWFVHTIGARLGDQEVFKVSTNFSLSENPTVRFRFVPSHEDKDLTVYAIDSTSKQYEKKIPVPGTLSQ